MTLKQCQQQETPSVDHTITYLNSLQRFLLLLLIHQIKPDMLLLLLGGAAAADGTAAAAAVGVEARLDPGSQRFAAVIRFQESS